MNVAYSVIVYLFLEKKENSEIIGTSSSVVNMIKIKKEFL